MKILLLNQCFHPEHVATSRYLADLGLELVKRGHEVTAVCSRRAYDDPKRTFPAQETWNGISIIRVWNSGFGKKAFWRRLSDFITFGISAAFTLLLLPRQDKIICLTTPPLISVLAAVIGLLKNSKVINWVMDLNPDEAIAMGLLSPTSWKSRFLVAIQRSAFQQSTLILALDRFMADRIKAAYVADDRVKVAVLWTHDDILHFDASGREEFRKAHQLTEKFVVMYSGNHSPCHPLDAILDAAKSLSTSSHIHFLFVGGGVRLPAVKAFAESNGLRNISCLPYQPSSVLSGSLSAADLHLVVMGDPFVGIVHPCKIYNILAVGRPFLFVGPEKSHVTDLMANHPLPSEYARHAAKGDSEAIRQHIEAASGSGPLPPSLEMEALSREFAGNIMSSRLADLIENYS